MRLSRLEARFPDLQAEDRPVTRLDESTDPICREAVRLTLQYAAYVCTERVERPIVEGKDTWQR